MEVFKRKDVIYGGAVLVLAVGIVILLGSRAQLQEHVATLTHDIEQKSVRLSDYEDIIGEQEEQLEVHKELLRIVRQESSNTSYDLSQMRAMVAQATQTVEDIKKLEEADKELLAKYSKVYFLNEHYIPENLVYIPENLVYSSRDQQIKNEVRPFLLDMFAAMEQDGLNPRIISGYRSYGYQENLKHNHQVTYGTTEANKFVADQGFSEHQLGTTVDIVSTDIGSDMVQFDTTPEYAWLQQHAHTYGFTLSYPRNNEYYAFEPWHWRFVGIALATQLYENGTYFYDVPQRDIDAFRITMFDQPQS